MARDRTDVLVRMPAELKRRLAEEVQARRSNLNDVAIEILASRYAVPFQGSGRRAGRPSGKGDVLLRMPAELKSKLARVPKLVCCGQIPVSMMYACTPAPVAVYV